MSSGMATLSCSMTLVRNAERHRHHQQAVPKDNVTRHRLVQAGELLEPAREGPGPWRFVSPLNTNVLEEPVAEQEQRDTTACAPQTAVTPSAGKDVGLEHDANNEQLQECRKDGERTKPNGKPVACPLERAVARKRQERSTLIEDCQDS